MYKFLSLLVLVALAAFVFAEKQDQETAEQFYATYGYYPSWYNAVAAPAVVRSYGYSYGAYPYAGYAYATGYPYAARAYPYAGAYSYGAVPFYG